MFTKHLMDRIFLWAENQSSRFDLHVFPEALPSRKTGGENSWTAYTSGRQCVSELEVAQASISEK